MMGLYRSIFMMLIHECHIFEMQIVAVAFNTKTARITHFKFITFLLSNNYC